MHSIPGERESERERQESALRERKEAGDIKRMRDEMTLHWTAREQVDLRERDRMAVSAATRLDSPLISSRLSFLLPSFLLSFPSLPFFLPFQNVPLNMNRVVSLAKHI